MTFCTCAYKQKYSTWPSVHALINRNIPHDLLHMRLQTEIFHASFCTCAYQHKYFSWSSAHALTSINISYEVLQMRMKQKYCMWTSAHVHINRNVPYEVLHITNINKYSIWYSGRSNAHIGYNSIWASTHALTNKTNPCRAIKMKGHVVSFNSIHW
jgi:hypothetical protein